jgi:hypothetical protein
MSKSPICVQDLADQIEIIKTEELKKHTVVLTLINKLIKRVKDIETILNIDIKKPEQKPSD